jgi:hypothetical protein
MTQVQRDRDKKRQLSFSSLEGYRKIIFNFDKLNKMIRFGIENAINECKVQ